MTHAYESELSDKIVYGGLGATSPPAGSGTPY